MSDLLSAASLFLAVVGLLYSVWYGEITKVLVRSVSEHKDDRGPIIRETRAVYLTRALPLALASLVLAVVLFPDLVAVLVSTFRTVFQKDTSAACIFDAVKALFCAIAVTSIGLAAHTLHLAWRTRSRWKKLNRID